MPHLDSIFVIDNHLVK